MPSEHLSSQSQVRPSLGGHRSTNSINSQTDSPSTTPPQHGKSKHAKHVVGGRGGHTRVPSSKGLHKLTKAHGVEGSHTDLKKLGRNSSSTTNLKKNTSHVSLKRNRSSADIIKRPKSSNGQTKRPASVHFEIGDQDDAWEEASSSASPALSRSASRPSSGQSSVKPPASASSSQPHSPPASPIRSKTVQTNGTSEKSARHPADAKVITERLLQRTGSHHNTTKMSLATATPSGQYSPDEGDRTTLNGTPQIGSNNEALSSRFVGGSGTPSENSPFLPVRRSDTLPSTNGDEVKRAHSMGNLTRRDSDEESALVSRSRKSSTGNAYPPPQSRTQQKLWLQRASSNIEPQQLAPVAMNMNGLGLHGGLGGTSLVGGAYDGRDPRIKVQLERTGLEYLVVRRHQDPVGKAVRRLAVLTGREGSRRIPGQPGQGRSEGNRYGLSQSLKDARKSKINGGGSSFEGSGSPPVEETGSASERGEDEGVATILRGMWEKNFDLSASAD